MAIEKRKFGKNGPELSILGFGAMRLPGFSSGKFDDHMDGAVDLLKKGIESGINYIDTAQLYDQGYSEKAVGKAIKDYRENVTISTKLMAPFISSADMFKSMVENGVNETISLNVAEFL